MIRSETLEKFLPAFRATQSALKPITKDATNPFFKSKYADLASVYNEVQPIANKNNLSITQNVNIDETGNMVVETIIWHDSGQHLGGCLRLTPVPDKGDKCSPQAIGSAITYARRYGLMAAFGIPADDDDGNKGSGQKVPPAPTIDPPKKSSPRGLHEPTEETPDPSEFDDVAYIERLAAETQTPILTIIQAYKVKSLSDLTPKQRLNVVNRLKAKQENPDG